MLRDWKPKDKSFCPAPDWDYLQKQAAVAWGYPTLSAWKHESAVDRGEVLAWFLEKNIRDGYEQEMQEAKAKRDAGKKPKGAQDQAPAMRYGTDLLLARQAAIKAREGAG